MLPIAMAALQALASFSVPDASAWHWRLELSGSGPIEIPGAKDFHEPEGDLFEMSDPQARASGGAFRASLHTPEWHRWTAHGAVSLGERTRKWDGLAVNTLYLALGASSQEATELEARMTVTAPFVELAAGAEYHPWRRHFFGAEMALPIQLADGDLEYEEEGETIHSGKAPGSFREATIPRLMLTYDYRLFDRIDLGFGFSALHGDYFAETPEADIDSLGRIRLEHGSTGPWIEVHAGWTFGRAAQ